MVYPFVVTDLRGLLTHFRGLLSKRSAYLYCRAYFCNNYCRGFIVYNVTCCNNAYQTVTCATK